MAGPQPRHQLFKRFARFFPNPLEDLGQGAESGESGLEHIGSDKGREPEPVVAVDDRQEDTDEDKRTGKGENKTVDIHAGLLI